MLCVLIILNIYINIYRIVDNLPAAQKFKTIITNGDKEIDDFIYEPGYPLGYIANSGGKKFIMLNNHIDLIILYHSDPRYQDNGHRIVGFEVQTRSIDHNLASWDDKKLPQDNRLACNSNLNVLRLSDENGMKDTLDMVWTYSVKFDRSEIKWAMRYIFLLSFYTTKFTFQIESEFNRKFQIQSAFFFILVSSMLLANH